MKAAKNFIGDQCRTTDERITNKGDKTPTEDPHQDRSSQDVNHRRQRWSSRGKHCRTNRLNIVTTSTTSV